MTPLCREMSQKPIKLDEPMKHPFVVNLNQRLVSQDNYANELPCKINNEESSVKNDIFETTIFPSNRPLYIIVAK